MNQELVSQLHKMKDLVELLLRERDLTQAELQRYRTGYPPGHFYSPLPALEEVRRREVELFDSHVEEIHGIELNADDQVALLRQFGSFYETMPFTAQKTEGLRYYFENNFYSYGDAIALHAMIRYLRPKRIIEVGSGFSSAVMLDTNRLFFDGSIECTFIEPYPERLLGVTAGDQIRLIQQPLETLDLALFAQLEANDILFIDSTHVAKIGSDVQMIFNHILPSIPAGVYVHIHDIFHPFEYPKDWVYEGRAWNEAYMLRAFLQFNETFEIVFWNDYLANYHRKALSEHLPLFLNNTGGSIWLRKVK